MRWFSRKSSSGHLLDPYQGLSHAKKIAYLGMNLTQNIIGSFQKSHLSIHAFTPSRPEPYLPFLNPQDSPSRKLCNVFWMCLPWAEMQMELGGEIHTFDIGCGAGNYGPFLQKHSGQRLTSYTGIDVEANPLWKTLATQDPSFYAFHRFQGQDIRPFFTEKTNLILSQSALEHIPEDIAFFEQVREFIEARKRPTIQIHLFPAAATFSLYPFHGIRQYTPATIARLIAGFDPSRTRTHVYALGSKESIRVHQAFIFQGLLHKRHDQRKEAAELYKTEGERALLTDLRTNDAEHPSFYALILQSYGTNDLPSVSR